MTRIRGLFRFDRIVLLLSLCLLVLGAWEAWGQWSNLERTRAWRSVKGEVLSGHMEVEKSNGRFGDGWRSWAAMRYRYVVDGRTYRGERVYLGETVEWYDEEYVEAFLAAHPDGSVIDVHYDPADPRDSALLLEVSYGWALLYGFFGLFAGVAGLAIGLDYRDARPAPPRQGVSKSD